MRFVFLLTWLLFLLGCGVNSLPQRPTDVSSPELVFQPPEVATWQLANGLTVYYRQNEEIQFVRGGMFFPGGGLFDAKGLEGVAALTGAQMRNGSVRGLSPEAFDQVLDDLGATIETEFHGDYGSLKFSCLSEDFREVLSYVSRVLREPAFDRKRFALGKHLAADAIRRRRDDPWTMADMLFSHGVYGATSPYARATSPASLQRIAINDLRSVHQRFVRPTNAVLGLTSSLTVDQVRPIVDEALREWRGSDAQTPIELPIPQQPIRPGIYVLERDFDQATIIIGHRGPPRLTDDHFTINVFSRVFGHGGFSSVLFREVRSKRGLAYSVWGGFLPGSVTGTFEIAARTRAEEALTTVTTIADLVQSARQREYPAADILDAQHAVARSYVFRFDTPYAEVSRKALLHFFRYPEDFDATYLERVRAVTGQQMLSVAQREINPEQMVVAIVGRVSAQEIRDQFPATQAVFRVDFDTAPRIVEELKGGT